MIIWIVSKHIKLFTGAKLKVIDKAGFLKYNLNMKFIINFNKYFKTFFPNIKFDKIININKFNFNLKNITKTKEIKI